MSFFAEVPFRAAALGQRAQGLGQPFIYTIV
jgi:hypothetical protein